MSYWTDELIKLSSGTNNSLKLYWRHCKTIFLNNFGLIKMVLSKFYTNASLSRTKWTMNATIMNITNIDLFKTTASATHSDTVWWRLSLDKDFWIMELEQFCSALEVALRLFDDDVDKSFSSLIFHCSLRFVPSWKHLQQTYSDWISIWGINEFWPEAKELFSHGIRLDVRYL